jgi:hypothetical protein
MPLPADFDLPNINPQRRSTRWSSDNPPPYSHRPRGATGKITRDLRHGIIEAATNLGRDGQGTDGLIGFLEDLGMHHKKAFASLLVKLLPLTVHGEGLAAPAVGQVNIVTIPHDHYVTKAAIEELSPKPVIKHEPMIEHEVEPAVEPGESDRG